MSTKKCQAKIRENVIQIVFVIHDFPSQTKFSFNKPKYEEEKNISYEKTTIEAEMVELKDLSIK